MYDWKWQPDDNGIYDIALESGDVTSTDGFNTAIQMSLFIDARANQSEVAIPEYRRGWWGDITNNDINHVTGSKNWLYYQARNTPATLNGLKNSTYNSVLWLQRKGYLKSITINAVKFNINKIDITMQFTAYNSETESSNYTGWINTGGVI
jgi:phage gp46-like protein